MKVAESACLPAFRELKLGALPIVLSGSGWEATVTNTKLVSLGKFQGNKSGDSSRRDPRFNRFAYPQ